MTKGDKTFELTSNDEGIALSDKLELGEYKVTEVTAPKGYKATSEVFAVNVTSNGGVLTVKNTKEKVETSKVEEPKQTKVEEPKNVETPKSSETSKESKVLSNQAVVRKAINKDVPKTGDDMNIILYGIIFSFAAGMMTYFLKRRSR